jgi:drug/metabolite transporter (DMT)-like permease
MSNPLHEKLKGKYTGEGALLLVTLIWGGTFTIVKLSLADVSSMMFIGLRFSIATIILLPFALKKLKLLSGIQLRNGLILGFILFLSFATQTVGLKYTAATRSGFITGSVVLFIPLFQVIIERRKPSGSSMAGAFLVLCGLILLSVKGTSLGNLFQEIGSDFNIGDFLTILCAVFYAVYVVYLDMFSREIETTSLVFLQLSTTSVSAFIFLLILSYTGIENFYFHLTNNLILSLIYTSILATLITTFLQTKYQKNVTPTMAGIIFSFEPVFAAFIAIMFINESIYGFGIAGCILIFSGLLVSELFKSKDLSREI